MEKDLLIHITGCSKSFGEKSILQNISFDIFRENKFISILGKTGSGKTTLLRLIAGLEIPDDGSIYLNGKLVSVSEKIIIPPHKREIGFIFQDLALWPHFTVKENIAFGLKLKRKNNINDIIEQSLQEFGIADFKNNYPHQLSGGQQQLVALVRSIVLKPKFLLMDESLANLDVKLKNQIRQLIKQLTVEKNIIVLYITHDHKDAISLSDKIMLLNEGSIAWFGEPSKISQANHTFVKEFLEI